MPGEDLSKSEQHLWKAGAAHCRLTVEVYKAAMPGEGLAKKAGLSSTGSTSPIQETRTGAETPRFCLQEVLLAGHRIPDLVC